MEPVKVSKSVIVDLIRELFDKPAEKDIEAPRPRGMKVQPISVNPVVDPMASITDPDNKKFAPQNKAEFQVAMGHIDLPEEKFDDLYKKINQTIKDLRKESETSSINTKTMKKDKENKKMANQRRDTQAEAFVRMQVRNILREAIGDVPIGKTPSRGTNVSTGDTTLQKMQPVLGVKSLQSVIDFNARLDNKLARMITYAENFPSLYDKFHLENELEARDEILNGDVESCISQAYVNSPRKDKFFIPKKIQKDWAQFAMSAKKGRGVGPNNIFSSLSENDFSKEELDHVTDQILNYLLKFSDLMGASIESQGQDLTNLMKSTKSSVGSTINAKPGDLGLA